MKSNHRETHPKSPRSGEDTDKNAKGSSERRPSKADETASQRQTAKRQPEGFVAKEHPLSWFMQLLERIHSIHEKIDEAFAGQGGDKVSRAGDGPLCVC
jgi:hypothetical protein